MGRNYSFPREVDNLEEYRRRVSDDDIEHALISVVPNSGYPTWGIPETLMKFEPTSRLAYNRLVRDSNLLEELPGCIRQPVIEQPEHCYQLLSMYTLLVSELLSRQPRRGEEGMERPVVADIVCRRMVGDTNFENWAGIQT
jgi:hypothetical protein